MARRAAPPNSTYLTSSAASSKSHDESAFGRFMREEIWAPEKRPGNFSILTGFGLFAGSIVAIRLWGEAMVPA
ncbi:hypothetical protein BOTBODRAFT_29673 [Botryobasidium botryosum FD-172 SS1]|uniref:Uncharacterized protein n=1 Tax=Botryobasidium botryosum (strain FD-172 SS1) TaxID=930990 RepID=A0A067MS02_BOTB1|nr:hypothetical protein BOTBODRAFT_29673 [Botryobasidium botryosum FD-172 SS1]